MEKDGVAVTNLNDQETEYLQRRGWFLVTCFQSSEGGQGSTAYNKAMDKALSLKREVGLRSYVKDNFTYWEVWQHF